MSWLRSLRTLVFAMPLVPAAFAFGHWSPSGLSVAQGCSGTGNVPRAIGWSHLSLLVDTTQPVAVATDGFLVFGASTHGLGLAEVLAGAAVSVSTADGTIVAGELGLLKDEGYGSFLIGWTANAPLSVGTKLKMTFAATPYAHEPIAGGAELEVVGAPTPLTTPELSLAGWVDFGHGVGETISCVGGSGGSCNGIVRSEVQVPVGEEQRRAVETRWVPPKVAGFVAWEGRVELSTDQPGAILPRFEAQFLHESLRMRIFSGNLGLLVFPRAPKDYCATLIVRDLRTGRESRSNTCGIPEQPVRAEVDYPLSHCEAPPNSALTERWCSLHPKSALPDCAPFKPGAVVAPDVTGAGGAAAGGTGAAAGTAMGDATEEPPARTSRGCQHAAAPPNAVAGLIALMAFGLLRRRTGSVTSQRTRGRRRNRFSLRSPA